MSVAVRDLQRNTSQVIDEVQASGNPVVVTRNGKPAVAILPLEDLEDIVLATSEFSQGISLAEEELRTGKTVSLDEL